MSAVSVWIISATFKPSDVFEIYQVEEVAAEL